MAAANFRYLLIHLPSSRVCIYNIRTGRLIRVMKVWTQSPNCV